MVKYLKSALIKAHRHSANNRHELKNSKKCGCFYCFEVYDAAEITAKEDAMWADESTAFCSRCGVDSVIGDSSGFPIRDKSFIEAMGYVWFNGYTRGHNNERLGNLKTRMGHYIIEDIRK